MTDHTEDNDPFEEDIVFDEAGLLGGKMPRSRQQSTVGFLPTFMLFIRTVFLCTAFVGLGLCVSVSGGPMIKLEVGIGVPTETAFHTFTARSFGMLLGGILGSLLFEVYNRQFLIFVSLVWVAVSVTVLPFTVPTALWWTFTTTASLGMGLGFLFTGGNVLCLDLWGRQGGASLQALHFSFAVGAFIVPLVIQPFFVGLRQMQLHNLSDMQDLATIDTTEMSRFIRELQDGESTEYRGENSSVFDIQSLTSEEVLQLTLPQVNITHETTLLNKTGNLTGTTTSLNYDSEPSSSLETTPAISITIPVPNITSTVKTKMKPTYTDANKLEPDTAKVWKKPVASETKTKPNIPDPAEKKNQAVNVASTSSPDINPIKTSQGEAGEITPVPLLITQHVMGTGSHVHNTSLDTTVEGDVASERLKMNQTRNASLTAIVEGNMSTENVYLSTTLPIISINETSQNATSTMTTTRPPTTTTTKQIVVTTTISPVTITTTTPPTTTTTVTSSTTVTTKITTSLPKLLNMNTYKIEFPDSMEEHQKLLDTDMTGNTDSRMFGDYKGEENYWGNIKDADDTNVPEPKVLDLREPSKDELEDLDLQDAISDKPSDSGISSQNHLLKPGTFSNGSDENSQFLDNMAQRFKDYGVTKVHLAYICIGIFIILNALISVVILCHNPRETRSKQDDGNMSKMQRGRVVVFAVIFSVFMFMAEALQGAVHHLLASSATGTGLDIIQETKIDGQVLFWGLVCLVRFLCILVSGCLRLKPGKLLVISVLLSFIGSIFLAIGSFGKEDFLWGGVIFLAIGLAPVLPTSLLWMAQYMRVTHRMCALMIIMTSFGNSLTHSLLTRVAGNSHAYAYILVTISFVSLFFLLLSMCILYTAQRSKTLGIPVGYQLASQHEEEDSIELTPSGSAVFTPNDPRIRENGEAGQSLLID
nr:uncharacterized protein LOC123768909 [Procambarus clarkii]XP_045615662.1 uncharacterized protein LOC123768909 [Procambarus clarkii]